MEGIEPTAEERGRYGQEIARQVEAGLLEDTGDRVRLTRRGFSCQMKFSRSL